MVGFIKDSKVIKGRVGGVWGLVCVCVGGSVARKPEGSCSWDRCRLGKLAGNLSLRE